MRRTTLLISILLATSIAGAQTNTGNDLPTQSIVFSPAIKLDTSHVSSDMQGTDPSYRNAWGLDVLVSNDGFGLGAFYRREFTEDLFGFVTFSISESKDEREFEQYNPYTFQSFTPGKLQRFLVMPLMFGVQKRLFSDEITDNFRPFVNAGVGPALILSAPFTEFRTLATGVTQATQVEFFKSLGRSQAHYTAGAFIGAGANFGSEKSNVFGVNFRYYFTYLFGKGLPSMYKDQPLGEVLATKKDFGGFFITLNVGMAY
jgi:hypothetical protein